MNAVIFTQDGFWYVRRPGSSTPSRTGYRDTFDGDRLARIVKAGEGFNVDIQRPLALVAELTATAPADRDSLFGEGF